MERGSSSDTHLDRDLRQLERVEPKRKEENEVRVQVDQKSRNALKVRIPNAVLEQKRELVPQLLLALGRGRERDGRREGVSPLRKGEIATTTDDDRNETTRDLLRRSDRPAFARTYELLEFLALVLDALGEGSGVVRR